MQEYSPDKALFYHDRLHQLSIGQQPSPVHVLLVISDLCSHDCSFCLFRSSVYVDTTNKLFGMNDSSGKRNNNPNRMIPFGKISEILKDCRDMGVQAIELTGGGEPSVHPQFDDVLKLVIDSKLRLGLITHGASLSDIAIGRLMNAAWVRVSIDAGNSMTYAKIRGVGESQYLRAVRNISALVCEKSRTGSALQIGTSFVITADNYHEIVDAAIASRELGVDTFRLSAEFGPHTIGLFSRIDDEVTELCNIAVSLATEGFRVINRWPLRKADCELGSPDYSQCSYQHFTTFIGGDQNVYRCCTTSYNERGLLGSLKEQSFAELWQSQEKQCRATNFNARACSYCHVNDRNRVINAAIQPQTHPSASFI